MLGEAAAEKPPVPLRTAPLRGEVNRRGFFSVLGLGWAAGCGSPPEVVSKVAAGDTDSVIAARGLTPDDIYAAFFLQ